MPKQKHSTTETGNFGEALAVQYLKEKEYRILHQNWRYKRAEIDIIAQKDRLLVFVEVKTKRAVTFGYPEDAVDEKKASKVIEGAEQFIYETNWHDNIRFDVIAIQLTDSGHKLRHFEDAFF